MHQRRTVDGINAGIRIAAEAVQADYEERYGEAKRLYGKAVHLLLPFTRNADIPAQQRVEMGQRIDQYRIRLRSLDRVVSEAAISPARRSPRQFKVKYDPTRTGLATPRRDDPSNRTARGSPRYGAGRLNNSNSTLSGEALQGLNLNGSDSAQRPRSAQGHKLFRTSKPSPSISSQHSPMLSSRKSLTPKRSLDVPTALENEVGSKTRFDVPLARMVNDKPGWDKRTKVPKDILSSPVSQRNFYPKPKVSDKGENSSNNKQGSEQLKANQYNSQLEQNIMQELMEKNLNVKWNDIAGLEKAKRTLQEAVILPALRPDLFQGLRAPPRGVLLFGPPGTGKTMLAKCVATESHANFFNISASSLTSKWHGEGEKLVRKLFEIARRMQPSVIFIDEIDSLLSSRRENEHDAVRRLKTEFLVHLDGAGTNEGDRVLIMGATNRPDDLDDAMIRRLTKRIYIGLPTFDARITLIQNLLKKQPYDIGDNELRSIVELTEGFSGSDLANLCREAAFGPIRELGSRVMTAAASDVRSLQYVDFQSALENIRPSVTKESIVEFEAWSKKYSST